VLVVFCQAAQPALQRRRPVTANGRQQTHAGIVDFEQRSIDAVHAGAGHQAEVEGHARP